MSLLTQHLAAGQPLLKTKVGRHARVLKMRANIQAASVAAPVRTQMPVIDFDKTAAQALKQQINSELKHFSRLEDTSRFEEEAYLRLRQGFLSDETQELLKSMHTDANAPSAVLLRGLPCEDDLPPTGEEPPVAMEGHLAEALIYGLARVWGRAAGFQSIGARGVIRDLITSNSTVYSSSTELLMHRDFGLTQEAKVPDLRLILCMRPDKARKVKTLVADNRDIIKQLDPADVALLRSNKLQFYTSKGDLFGIAKPTIAGDDDFPVVSLFDEGVLGPGSRIEAENSEAVAAYHRASSLAKEIAAEVVLQEGDMLVIHNGRAVHARTESPIEPDGFGRWMKVTFVIAEDKLDGYFS